MFQSLVLAGRLGKDPETRVTQGGDPVTKFSIAVGEWDSKKKEERTQWFDCTLWGETGRALSESMKAGDRILVRGVIRSRKYTPRDSDVERIAWEVQVYEHRRIDFKKKDASGAKPKDSDNDGWDDDAPAKAKAKPAETKKNDFDDDIPW